MLFCGYMATPHTQPTKKRSNQLVLIAKNKKVFFDYEILDKYECGIVLTGPEVKSIRGGRVQLKGSYVQFINNRMVIVNMHISEYKPAANASYDPTHTRSILLRKNQIEEVRAKLEQKGLTVVPLEIYLKGNLIKVQIGVCKGRKQFDKREVLKERAIKRDIEQKVKFR